MQSETVTNTASLANHATPRRAANHGSPSVLLVGASVRWAAQSAAAGGYRVISMDLFGDLDTRDASARFEVISSKEQADPDQLGESIARLADQERATVVWVGGLRSAIGGAATPAHLSHEELVKLARDAGLRSPETVPWHQNRRPTDARWLVKESNSTGGLGVRFFDPCLSRSIRTDAVLQRWVPGRALGLVAIADAHRVSLLGMTRSISHRWGDLPFVYAGSRTLAHDDVAQDDAIPWSAMQTICERIAEARGLRGLFNLDWIHDRHDQWWLLEINERPSASCEVIERAMRTRGGRPADASLMQMHLAALLSDRAPSANTFPNAAHSNHAASTLSDLRSAAELGRGSSSIHIKRIVFSRRDGRIHLSALEKSWRNNTTGYRDAVTSCGLSLADIPADGTPVQRGQPIATLLLDGVRPGTSPASALVSPASTLRRAIRQLHAVVI